jgi:hypothetical protein
MLELENYYIIYYVVLRRVFSRRQCVTRFNNRSQDVYQVGCEM